MRDVGCGCPMRLGTSLAIVATEEMFELNGSSLVLKSCTHALW